MAEPPIQIGDRVINLQVPGIFTVVSRRGPYLDIETDEGLRMTLVESAVRRVAVSANGASAAETPADDDGAGESES